MKIVEYNTAVLAKQKGFDDAQGHRIDVYETLDGEPYTNSYWDPPSNVLLAPHQSVLQAWLRRRDINVYCFYTASKRWGVSCGTIMENSYETYEEALEFGLIEGLKLVENYIA